jgi:hypothetical protein
VWQVVADRDLDLSQRILAWRIAGAFLRRIHAGDAAAASCPHDGCGDTLATLSHIFITCPLAAQVLDWVCATWAAVTGKEAPPRSADLFLADDRPLWAAVLMGPAPILSPMTFNVAT